MRHLDQKTSIQHHTCHLPSASKTSGSVFCSIGSHTSPRQEFLRFFLDGLAEDLNVRGGAGSNGGAGGKGGDRGLHRHQKRSDPPPPPVEPNLSDEEVSRLTAEHQADRAWALHLARNDSAITSMFCGQLQSRISCLSCGNVSFCFDPFFDLSVPLPSTTNGSRAGGRGGGRGGDEEGGGYVGKYSRGGGGRESRSVSGGTHSTTTAAVTLEECLRAFSTEETLDGENRPVCAHCRRRRKSAKRLAVHRFPPALVIHLKRFQYDSTSRTKLSTAVDFPIQSGLDLGPYSTLTARLSSSGGGGRDGTALDHRRWEDNTIASNAGSPESSLRDTIHSNNGRRSTPPLYELYAVCNHMGGLQGGHYTAHCRSWSSSDGGGGGGGVGGGGCGSASAAEWHTFDDSRVGSVTASHVGGASAYVLFYRLFDDPERVGR